MAEVDRQRIKSIYSLIKGALSGLTSVSTQVIPKRVAENYNQQLVDLTALTRSEFRTFQLQNSSGMYMTDEARISMSSVIERLASDFGFDEEQQPTVSAPVVLMVNQSQQMEVTVQSISQIISEQKDDVVKKTLDELKAAVERRDSKATGSILSHIADKSWELFLKLLPYILQTWGSSHS